MITRREALRLIGSVCPLALGCSAEPPPNQSQPNANQITPNSIQAEPAKSSQMTFKTIDVTGKDAVNKLNEYREKYQPGGEYPVIIGDESDLDMIQEIFEAHSEEPSAIIEASYDVNLDGWIANRKREMEEYELDMVELLGQWPGESPNKGAILLHTDIGTGEPKPSVVIGLPKLEEPWQLPAAIKYGGWNECPEPKVQCAFHRQWMKGFGAQITGASGDVIECTVANPPTDRESAVELAWQQYWYCADIVDQGTQTINNLAASLLNSHYWYFWWD